MSNNDDNQNKFDLKLSKILEDSKIVEEFYIDINEQFLKLKLNNFYNPPIALTVGLETIKEKNGLEKFTNRFRDIRKTYKKVSEEHKDWIYSAINDNVDLIKSCVFRNKKW